MHNNSFIIDCGNPVNRLHPLNVGRVAWWLTIPGFSGGAKWMDLMNLPHGSHGSLTNMTSVSGWRKTNRPGRFGHMQFDGIDDVVAMGNPQILRFNGGKQITVAAWVNLTTAPSSTGSVAVAGRWQSGGGGGFRTYTMAIGGSGTVFPGISWFSQNSNGTVSFSTANVNPSTYLGIWNHFAGTYDGTSMRLYTNGVQVGSTISFAGPMDTSSMNFCIGQHSDGFSPIAALIDDVSIWNRGLNSMEVKNYYDLSCSGYPGLLCRLSERSSILPSTLNRRRTLIAVGVD